MKYEFRLSLQSSGMFLNPGLVFNIPGEEMLPVKLQYRERVSDNVKIGLPSEEWQDVPIVIE